jgi:fumarate hydratase subunit beta/L(+)-tartrate dehydratase beta subunit
VKEVVLHTPVTEEQARDLQIGDIVYVVGNIYTSRDMGHKTIKEALEAGQALPKDFNGSAIFHAGPVALKNDDGSYRLVCIGPTTSIRMEPYADMVGKLGIKLVIGKGGMAAGTLAAAKKYGYVYLQAAPGCAQTLTNGLDGIDDNGKDVSWIELGVPEALWNLKAVKFGPLIVGMDSHEASIYDNLKVKAQKKIDELYPLS